MGWPANIAFCAMLYFQCGSKYSQKSVEKYSLSFSNYSLIVAIANRYPGPGTGVQFHLSVFAKRINKVPAFACAYRRHRLVSSTHYWRGIKSNTYVPALKLRQQ